MARDATVKTVLTASDQASGPLRNFQNTIRGVKTEMGDMNDVAGMLKGGIAGIAAAAGVDAFVQIAQGAMELGRAGEQASILRTAFDQTAAGVGAASASMLSSLQAASGGMIADTDLMLAANRAMMLGVADSAGEMGQLLEVAAVRGRAMGLSTSQAFNDLVTGLGRMSPLILDNLGIVTGGEAVFTAYAASIGKAADALTDAERKQALFNKVVASTDTSGELVVSQFERMDAAIQNAKTAMGELFGPAVAAIAQQLADSVNAVFEVQENPALETELADLRKNLQDATTEWLNLKRAQEAAADLPFASGNAGFAEGLQPWDTPREVAAPDTSKLDAARQKMDEAGEAVQRLEQRMKLYASGMDALDPKLDRLDDLQRNAADSGRFLAEAERLVAENASAMSGAVGRAAGAIDTIRGKFVQAAVAGMSASLAFQEFSKFKGLEDQANQIREGLGNLGFYDQEEISFFVDLNTERALMSADDMIKAFDDMNTAAGGAASGGVSDLQRGLDSLQGRALGAVQQATTLSPVGVDPSDFLPREDAVQENAFRLAAIMREGLIGQPWLEEFKAEVPAVFNELVASGDVQGSAARILQDFQAGLRPELLDLGAIKEKIKQEIAGQEAMELTAAQITAELTADTGGDSADIQAKVNKALGLGVASADLTDGIVGQLNSSTFNAQLNTAAGAGGKAWGNTFLATVEANVPPALVALLVNLTTPGVLAAIQAQQGLTGPVEP